MYITLSADLFLRIAVVWFLAWFYGV